MSGLTDMVDSVRAERRRLEAGAPAGREKNRLYAARQWKERKRRAYEKARSVFEGAFRRQFFPERFTYWTGEANRCQYTGIGINFEGKLWAYCHVYNEPTRPTLVVRPVGCDADVEKRLNVNPEALYGELAKLIEKWGLA